MRRTFRCPSYRKYDDGEGDDDVEDLTHDGSWDERVNPCTRDWLGPEASMPLKTRLPRRRIILSN